MALFRNPNPNVKALANQGDVAGLVAAAGFQDLMPAPDGDTVDRGAPVRQEAILALGALGPEHGTDAVRAALSDPSDEVRVAAIRVLYARKDAVAIAAALAWLPAGVGHTRALAIMALVELRRPESAPAVATALLNAPDDAAVEDDEATLLTLLLDADEGSDAPSEVAEVLLVALADERDTVADRAEELLALTAAVSTEGVIAELKAGAAPHRAAAVLSQIKDTRALEPLMEGLLHRDPRVRAECATALGELRDPAAVEALIRASQDPEHRVRAEAGWALDRLGMVALVVGVSTMIRPMILDAVTAAGENRPALTEGENGSSGRNGDAGENQRRAARPDARSDHPRGPGRPVRRDGRRRWPPGGVLMLRSPTAAKRAEDALALAELDSPESVEALTVALDDPDVGVRAAAGLSLASLRDPASTSALAGIVAGWAEPALARARRAALNTLIAFRTQEAAVELARALATVRPARPLELQERSALMAVAYAEAAGVAAPRVVRALVTLIAHEERSVADRAAALLMLFPAESHGPLARALRTADDAEVRRRAATALGACRQDAAVTALVAALQDPAHPKSAPPRPARWARCATRPRRARSGGRRRRRRARARGRPLRPSQARHDRECHKHGRGPGRPGAADPRIRIFSSPQGYKRSAGSVTSGGEIGQLAGTGLGKAHYRRWS